MLFLPACPVHDAMFTLAAGEKCATSPQAEWKARADAYFVQVRCSVLGPQALRRSEAPKTPLSACRKRRRAIFSRPAHRFHSAQTKNRIFLHQTEEAVCVCVCVCVLSNPKLSARRAERRRDSYDGMTCI